MKKKLLVILLTMATAATLLTACGGKNEEKAPVETTELSERGESEPEAATESEPEGTGESDTKSLEEVPAESPETEESEEVKEFLANYNTYLGWKAEEWTAASDSEKEQAGYAYLLYLAAGMKQVGDTDEARAEFYTELKAEGGMEEIVAQMEVLFEANKNISIQEFTDEALTQLKAAE